ncbi:unnamed protein product [Toxocara canis]|uniref:Uncharacterized protein n=1 Tax=Toxocara canis TaxID=6265 RepID=A0A3P7H2L7_TOXCA|nr:unnamed protein product [Toxocara canis]
MGVPREEQMKPSTSKSTVQNLSTPASSFFNIPPIDDVRWLAFVAVAILLFIAYICVRFRRKRGSTNNRAYGMRHRSNMDEDEDDLLISSMYS